VIFLAFFVPFPYSDCVDVIVILFVCVSHQSFVPQFSTACFGYKLTQIFGVQSCHSVIQSGAVASFPDSLHWSPSTVSNKGNDGPWSLFPRVALLLICRQMARTDRGLEIKGLIRLLDTGMGVDVMSFALMKQLFVYEPLRKEVKMQLPEVGEALQIFGDYFEVIPTLLFDLSPVQIHAHADARADTQTRTSTHTHTHTHAHTHTHTRTLKHTHTYIFTYTRTHAHTYVRPPIHTFHSQSLAFLCLFLLLSMF